MVYKKKQHTHTHTHVIPSTHKDIQQNWQIWLKSQSQNERFISASCFYWQQQINGARREKKEERKKYRPVIREGKKVVAVNCGCLPTCKTVQH